MIRNGDPKNIGRSVALFSASLVLSSISSQVFSSGFQLAEQNVTNLGTAYSGTAALAEDASTGYFNPAGLTRIADGQVVLSGVVIQSSAELSAYSSVSPTGRVLGPGQDNAGTVATVPTFHLAQRLDDRWVFGFNVTVPFGLATRYAEDSVARYIATNSEVITTDLGASIAYQWFPCFSIAAGPDALYMRANLSARTRTRQTLATPISAAAEVPADGFQRNNADGWGWGWHAGLLWEPTEYTRVGLNYRSNFDARLDGNTEALGAVTLPGPGLLTGSTQGIQTNYVSAVRTSVTLPETVTASLYHRFGFLPQLAVLADIAWTNWSRIQTLRLLYHRPLPTGIAFASPLLPATLSQFALLTPDTDTPMSFRDTRRYALGFTYTLDDTWLFRLGGAFDETPVLNEYRTARLPDANRYWLAAGAAYTYKAWRFDLGYAHLFFAGASINEHAPYGAQSNIPLTSAVLSGDYDSSANLFGVQARYDFL